MCLGMMGKERRGCRIDERAAMRRSVMRKDRRETTVRKANPVAGRMVAPHPAQGGPGLLRTPVAVIAHISSQITLNI